MNSPVECNNIVCLYYYTHLTGNYVKSWSKLDNRGDCFDYNADHPEYDFSGYTCEKCGKELTEEDES